MTKLAAIGSMAVLMLSQALILRAQDEPQKKEKEMVRAFTLKVTGDGHVELTTKVNGEEKTYKADSMEEFRKQYPDVAREYGVGRGGVMKFHSPEEFAKKLEEMKKHFGDFDFNFGPDFQKSLEGALKEKDVEGGHAANPRRLGVRLAPLSQVLADQLGVDARSAVQIAEVEPGSLAERSGLQKNDLLVKVDGKDVAGLESVRDTVQDALKKKEFELEILRHGKKQAVKVAPPSEK